MDAGRQETRLGVKRVEILCAGHKLRWRTCSEVTYLPSLKPWGKKGLGRGKPGKGRGRGEAAEGGRENGCVEERRLG